MNYLVLTPDGVGSTYLQRALTLYLNSSGTDYYNTHELLNGLELDEDNNLYKRMMGYNQSIDRIVQLIKQNEGNLVSRLAQYHVENRLNGQWVERGKIEGTPEVLERNKKENYDQLYQTCNDVFKIVYCTRNPFEYALSWSLRNFTGKYNVYSIQERISTYDKHFSCSVDLKFMVNKLDQYKRYIYWVKDNFKDATEVKYEDIHEDIDEALCNITGKEYKFSDSWNFSLQEYTTMLYNLSKIYNKNLTYSDNFTEYQYSLVKQKKLFRHGIPIKMTTLQDKCKSVVNFLSSLETYNKWAVDSNEYSPISEQEILDKIKKEDLIYN